MKKAFYFVLGIAFVILTSAGTVSIMTVKPEKPKSVTSFVGDIKQCSERILKYSQKGYVVKFITQSQSSALSDDYIKCLVVMEKY